MTQTHKFYIKIFCVVKQTWEYTLAEIL